MPVSQALRDELAADPLGLGYAGMSDVDVSISLGTANRERIRDTLSSAEIYEAIDVPEFQALSDGAKTYVRDILNLGDNVQISAGKKARTVLIGAFGGGSATITALAAAITDTISRAEELGIGDFRPATIGKARA